MNRKGVVLKVKSRSLIVLTGDFEFREIKKRGPARSGQEISFQDQDVIAYPGRWRHLAVALSLFLVLLISGSVLKELLVPEVYAYVGMDINPSLELALDEDLKVLRAVARNKDGERILQHLVLEGLPLRAAVSTVLETCIDRGYLTDNGSCVLITTTVVDDSGARAYQELLEEQVLACARAVLEKKQRQTDVYVLRAGLEERQRARTVNLSTGRYLLWNKAREAGVNLSREQVASHSIGEVMQRHHRLKAAVVRSAVARWEKRSPALPPAYAESIRRGGQGAGPEPKPGLAPEVRNDMKGIPPAVPKQPRMRGPAEVDEPQDDRPFDGETQKENEPPEPQDLEKQAGKPTPAPEGEEQHQPPHKDEQLVLPPGGSKEDPARSGPAEGNPDGPFAPSGPGR